MAIYIEDNLPNIRENGLNTLENTTVGGTLAVTGATTLASTLAVTGVATFTAAPVFSGGQTATTVVQSALVGATVVLTASQSGGVFINRSTSGSPSWTLPTNVAGLTYTFLTANTTAGFTVTGGTIFAKAAATGASVTGTTLTNTQATAVVGDAITLVADGTAWRITSQTGVFAAT